MLGYIGPPADNGKALEFFNLDVKCRSRSGGTEESNATFSKREKWVSGPTALLKPSCVSVRELISSNSAVLTTRNGHISTTMKTGGFKQS